MASLHIPCNIREFDHGHTPYANVMSKYANIFGCFIESCTFISQGLSRGLQGVYNLLINRNESQGKKVTSAIYNPLLRFSRYLNAILPLLIRDARLRTIPMLAKGAAQDARSSDGLNCRTCGRGAE
jgi:hypothetical protein